MSDNVDNSKKLQEEIEALRAKNSELLGINKKRTEELDSLKSSIQEMKEWKEQQEATVAEKEGDLKKQMEILKTKYEKKLSEWEAKYNEESTYNSRLLVDNNLQESLVKLGIKPELLNGAMALLKPKVKVINDAGERKPVVDDKPLSDFIKGWVESDGKAYKHIPQSVGGGATGSSSLSSSSMPNFSDKNFNLTDAVRGSQKIT